MQLLKSFIYSILAFQEKLLRFRLNKTVGVKNKSKSKKHYANGCTLDLNSMAETEKLQMEDEINNILKTYEYEPLKILDYVKRQGTAVKFMQDAKKILNPIGENEGFVFPANGSKGLYLSLAINKQFRLKTDGMFILSNGDINKYYFIYHFYNWYAFKHNIAGVDRESYELLKKYLFEPSSDIKELQLSEIYKLKDAIRQDKASLEFVIKLCKNYDGAKQALGKIKNDGSAKL